MADYRAVNGLGKIIIVPLNHNYRLSSMGSETRSFLEVIHILHFEIHLLQLKIIS